jgi:glycosyltransferase involved in cell wall biosynthesis
MKVLFVTLNVFGGERKGGGERYVTELKRALLDRGVVVETAVVSSITHFSRQRGPDDIPMPSKFRSFVRMVRESDVVHVHQINSPGFDYSLVLCKIFGKPIVLTDHGGGAITPGRILGKARLGFINAAGFVSTWSQNDLDSANVIRNYQILLGGGDHMPTSSSTDERFDFGFVGRLVPHKGAHVAIEALPANASLIVAGQIRDASYHEELLELAAGKKITFAPDASDEAISAIYKSVRYLVVPSVNRFREEMYSRPELLGLVALEALAVGTPVIGSDVGGLAEILHSAGQIVVRPGDLQDWKDAMIMALERSPPSVNVQNFTWGAVAEKCILLYNSLD